MPAGARPGGATHGFDIDDRYVYACANRPESKPGGGSNQELVIVDYKTGRSALHPDDARGSRALALYAYSTERMFRRRCRKVELHHLPTGNVASHEHTEDSMARHVRRAEDTARDIVAAEQAVAAGADPDVKFPIVPGPGCAWCDFRRTCPGGTQTPARQPWAAITDDGPPAQ